jgi:hypothetical protein
MSLPDGRTTTDVLELATGDYSRFYTAAPEVFRGKATGVARINLRSTMLLMAIEGLLRRDRELAPNGAPTITSVGGSQIGG